MVSLSYFYFIINALFLFYACYSWYWQANLVVRCRYRVSSIIWAVLFIWLAFTWNYIAKGDSGVTVFLALFLLISIIDGFTGLTNKRIVVAGYFKRTIKYDELEAVRIINIPNPKKPSVLCVFQTKNDRQYALRFNMDVEQFMKILKPHLDSSVKIEIGGLF